MGGCNGMLVPCHGMVSECGSTRQSVPAAAAARPNGKFAVWRYSCVGLVLWTAARHDPGHVSVSATARMVLVGNSGVVWNASYTNTNNVGGRGHPSLMPHRNGKCTSPYDLVPPQ